MGYTTEFDGQFTLDGRLSSAQERFLRKFSDSRRMKRDVSKIEKSEDHLNVKVGLGYGVDGEYFVDGEGDFGQGDEDNIVNYNEPPTTQPGLWCQWVPTREGRGIEWNGSEKFYNYVEWLQYIINRFLAPWGYTLTGEVNWEGEDNSDMGKIIVKDNKITTKVATITYN